MADTLIIYLSYHDSDAAAVRALTDHIRTAMGATAVQFTDRTSQLAGAKSLHFVQHTIEASPVILLFCSAAYFNHRDTLLERDYALRSPQQPLIVPLRARAVAAFPALEAYGLLPTEGKALIEGNVVNDLECALTASTLLQRIHHFRAQRQRTAQAAAVPLGWEEGRARLYAYLDRNGLYPSILLLQRLIVEPTLDRVVFDAAAEFQRLHRRTQHERLAFPDFWAQHGALYAEVYQLIGRLQPTYVRPDWELFLEVEYFGVKPSTYPLTGLWTLSAVADEIIIPETALGEAALNEAQQLEYKRLLILAQDAAAIGRHERSFAYADQIRHTLDPESAQLYEHLVVSFAHKETPERIVREALRGNRRLLDTVIMLVNRFRDYQMQGKCSAPSGYYNVAQVATALSEEIRRFYVTLPNDHVLDTGLNGQRYEDRRTEVLRCLELALDIYHFIHPDEGFLEWAFIELCGGGRYQWADAIVPENGQFRLVNRDEFDINSRLAGLRLLLCAPTLRNTDDPVEQTRHARARGYDPLAVLRGNLLHAIQRKRNVLQAAIEEERRYFREFIDERDSLIHLMHTAIVGYEAIDAEPTVPKSAFLDRLLDELVRQPEVPWFTLEPDGDLIPHPDSQRHGFAALTVLQLAVAQYAGADAWAAVRPQVHAVIFRQFAADIEGDYEAAKTGMQWRDIRRWHHLEARKTIIGCFKRWYTAYRAAQRLDAWRQRSPDTTLSLVIATTPIEQGEAFLQKILYELVGNGAMRWVEFNPLELVAHSDARALGYDAAAELERVAKAQTTLTPAEVSRQTVDNLFQKRILPAYQALPAQQERHRPALVGLLQEAMRGYQTYPHPDYLAWVYAELITEKKLPWVVIRPDGNWADAGKTIEGFSATAVLTELARLDPTRFSLYETRHVLANRRYEALEALYQAETSPVRGQNGAPERQLVIQIFQEIKGVFKFFPDRRFLELPIRELDGKGRIAWQSAFLGLFEVPENHYDNYRLGFDYKTERVEFRMYWDATIEWQQRMMDDIGA